ncbi:hypothetical protein BGZ50_000762 [Haplosporangium sp. Z 11]|nr:hypothetical protein BGZ50_000762 [Haplosporangium sp. Z 11]
MSVGSVVPFINDFLVIHGDSSLTIGGPIAEGHTKVVVLEFWATIPHLSELQRKYKDVDVTIVGSTNEPDEQKIRQFVKTNSMEYTVIMDKSQSLHSKVFKPSGATGIPFAAVIVNNKIVFSGHPMDPQFQKALDEAAAKASSTRREPAALPLITQSYEELMQMRPKELRQILQDRGIKAVGLSEKSEFANLILETCVKTQKEKITTKPIRKTTPLTMEQKSDSGKPRAPSPKERREGASQPELHYTRDELMHMHGHQLKEILDQCNIDHTAVVEKPEVVQLILDKCVAK